MRWSALQLDLRDRALQDFSRSRISEYKTQNLHLRTIVGGQLPSLNWSLRLPYSGETSSESGVTVDGPTTPSGEPRLHRAGLFYGIGCTLRE